MLNRKMQPAAVPPPAVVARSALKDRLLDPRTLISFGILAVVLFVVLTHVQFDYGESLRAISQVNVLIYALAFAAFYFSFVVRTVRSFIVGLLIAAGLIAGLLVVRYSEGRLSRYLPERLRERAARFNHGLLSAFAGRLPLLLGLTVLVWMAESTRLFLVVQALPLHISLSLAQIMFIALVASLLTTIPALPGGLVLVEGGIIAVLVFFGLSASQALSVAILDRLISYWSLIAVGLIVFLLSHRR